MAPPRWKKTRSRQKNRRKDTRPEEVKAEVAERLAQRGEKSWDDWYAPDKPAPEPHKRPQRRDDEDDDSLASLHAELDAARAAGPANVVKSTKRRKGQKVGAAQLQADNLTNSMPAAGTADGIAAAADLFLANCISSTADAAPAQSTMVALPKKVCFADQSLVRASAPTKKDRLKGEKKRRKAASVVLGEEKDAAAASLVPSSLQRARKKAKR